MAIYSRFGSEVQLTRPINTESEVEALDNRKADDHDRNRMSYGMYAAGTIDGDGKERLYDLAMLRADDGLAEINKAALAVGCRPR